MKWYIQMFHTNRSDETRSCSFAWAKVCVKIVGVVVDVKMFVRHPLNAVT